MQDGAAESRLPELVVRTLSMLAKFAGALEQVAPPALRCLFHTCFRHAEGKHQFAVGKWWRRTGCACCSACSRYSRTRARRSCTEWGCSSTASPRCAALTSSNCARTRSSGACSPCSRTRGATFPT
ncbi:hypothetical protein T492DRAFT_102147 [Pavlovales sp. CCMP2436]|nr:hypothetical protein T492DRAFT_102147 [Pavlovales sp. CCMP2436]